MGIWQSVFELAFGRTRKPAAQAPAPQTPPPSPPAAQPPSVPPPVQTAPPPPPVIEESPSDATPSEPAPTETLVETPTPVEVETPPADQPAPVDETPAPEASAPVDATTPDPSTTNETPASPPDQPTPEPPVSNETPPVAPDPTPTPQPPASTDGPMLALGCVDDTITDAQCAAFLTEVEQRTNIKLADVKSGLDKVATKRLPAVSSGAMSIKQIQETLTQLGFFPGGRPDGIYGYRTQAAVRLFQEYVRSVENLPCTPDGRVGPQTRGHLNRWLAAGQHMQWPSKQGEHQAWLGLLETVKQKYLQAPSPVLEKVNSFTGKTHTRRVADWDFGADHIHLIGVRRNQFKGKFDDVFVLLIKGMVFKFQGSTEPGASSNAAGPPYITPGQHRYRFGWHQGTYLALRPLPDGVLVVRAGADKVLDESDLARPLESNGTINIHWAGLGMQRDIGSWSEGCQVINGSVYLDPAHKLISCEAYAATRPAEPTTDPLKTRGAYNVLADLVTALSGDLPSGETVLYTLLQEEDLAFAPDLEAELTDARKKILTKIGV